MSIYSCFRLSVALSLCAMLIGCGSDEPTRVVQFDEGRLEMAISEDWELEISSLLDRVYAHNEIDNLRLHIVSRIDDYGSPLQVPHIKGVIGKELNLQYGGVTSRVSLGGNAMMRYTRSVADESGEEMRAEEWVIARPIAYSHVARVDISLRIPTTAQSHPSIATLIDRLDKQVGDARIPRA